MNSVIKQLSDMFKHELYSNVVRVCELAVTICEQKPDTITPFTKLQLYLYYADSLFNLQEYVQAESIYRQLIQLKKYMKTKSALKMPNPQNEVTNDVELRYKIHVCCLKQKQKQKAIEMLQSISARLRTPKVNMALGNLYLENGYDRSAVTCFKEVLREDPLALEAAENLLKLGVNGVEVNELMLKAMADTAWVSMWMLSQAQLHSRDYQNAINSFKSLDAQGLLKDNSTLLVNVGYCYNFLCDDKMAINYLQRAVHLEPNLKTGRDLLATLLAKSNDKENHNSLEKLLTPMVDMSLWSAEQWVVLGNYMFVSKKYDKAAYFGQQACLMSKRNVEALLLKANTLVQIGKYQDAALHCLEAQTYCPYRFDVYKCIVECYVRINRLREAEAMASNACKQLNQSAQALTLQASVVMKDPMTSSKVIRRLLEKAIAADPNYSPSVFLLAEQLGQEQLHEEASTILFRHLALKPTSSVHQMLADNLARLHRDDEAFDHYSIALRLDPANQRATEGLNNIGRTVTSNKRESFYSAVGESPSFACQGSSVSDHEPDPESDSDYGTNFMNFE